MREDGQARAPADGGAPWDQHSRLLLRRGAGWTEGGPNPVGRGIPLFCSALRRGKTGGMRVDRERRFS